MAKSETYIGNRLEVWQGMDNRWYARVRKASRRRYDIPQIEQGATPEIALHALKERLARISELHRW